MTFKRVLTSNERVRRLETLARQAFAERNFIKAESIWKEQIEMLESFRHVDDIIMVSALNNLALVIRCQGRVVESDKIDERVRNICSGAIAPLRRATATRRLTVAM